MSNKVIHPLGHLTPAQALGELKKGYARHLANEPMKQELDGPYYGNLAAGQDPYALVLGCMDSRAVPHEVFHQKKGDMFAITPPGNVAVDDSILAGIQYAVNNVGTPLVVVMGHTGCGAVGAAVGAIVKGTELPGHLPALVSQIEPAVRASMNKGLQGDALVLEAIKGNVSLSIQNILRKSAIIAGLVKEGKLGIVGAIYDIGPKNLSWLEQHGL